MSVPPARIVSTAAIAFALAMSGSVSLAGADGESIFPYPRHTRDLDNGLRVVVVPMTSNGLAAYWTIVRTGSRDEYEPGRSGFAHFFEHMMFRGTKRFPAEVYNRIVTELGADTNAFTTDDFTAYHLGIASSDLERVMEIESDRFMNLDYTLEAFQTEAGAVYGEYRKNRMNPFFSLYEAMRAAAFEVHTYGHTTMGYERDIQRMPELDEYSRSFFRRYYRPDNTVLLIVGDVEPEATFAMAERFYGDWERGYQPPQVRPEPEQTTERRVRVSYPGRSLPLLWIAYKIPAFDPHDLDRLAYDLLAELAFGATSEIHRKLVIDEQRVEFIQADADPKRDPYLFEVITRVKDPGDVAAVEQEITAAIAAFAETPPSTQRLDALRSRLKYAFLMGLTDPDAVASALARWVGVTGGVDEIDALFAGYAAITPEHVQRAAARLAPERRTVATLEGAR